MINTQRILIIKLGALGDFVQATAAFKAIRKHYPEAHITLMTTPAMMAFAKDLPWVDAIEIDPRKSVWNLRYMRKLHRQLTGFDMVFDLQTNDRTTTIYSRLAGGAPWCGIVKKDPLCHVNPQRDFMHSLDRLAEQLQGAGVTMVKTADLSYMKQDVKDLMEEFALKKGRFICILAGGSPHRPEKRWPHYAELIPLLERHGPVVLIGAKSEQEDLEALALQTGAINLCGRTSLGELVGLFAQAKAFVGNDTGPAHIAAASGLSGVVLFGSDSNPDLCAPRAEGVSYLSNPADIASISPQDVYENIRPLLNPVEG